MITRAYFGAIRLISMVLVFVACNNSHPESTAGPKADTTALPTDHTGNSNAFDPPPGDSNSMIRDSIYNADSAKHKPKK